MSRQRQRLDQDIEDRSDAAGRPPYIRSVGRSNAYLLERIHTMADMACNTTNPHASAINFIEHSSCRMIEEINSRNFHHPIFDLAVPDFRSSRVEAFAPTNTLQGHLDTFRQMAAETPEYQMRIDHMSTDVLDEGAFAKVYLTIIATGRPPGLSRETLAILTWRFDGEENGKGWRCISHDSMRNFAV